MNKHLFPVRALCAACASVCLAAAWLPLTVSAQSPATAASRPAAIRAADFIVAVVNVEPILFAPALKISSRAYFKRIHRRLRKHDVQRLHT